MNKNIAVASFFLSCFLSGFACGAVPVDDPWREAQDLSYFAMNGSKVFHVPGEMETSVKRRIEWMKELGVLWDRSDWWWHVIEPEKGKFDFSLPDRIIKRFDEERIQIYPILCYGAAWWKDRNAPLTDEDFDDFGKYVYETVSRYKDNFTYWSVWNEPNIIPFWTPEPNPDHYARLLKIAYDQAKKADPDCKICAPVIAPLGAWDKNFTQRLFQLQCLDYIDVFDYHYYRNEAPEDEVPDEIADIRAFMRRYGVEKPIWISESGVSGYMEDKEASYKKQAALVVRNQLLSIASGVKRFFYFDLQNWNDAPGESWDSKLGLVEAGGTKKPAFHAYKTMVKEVDYKDVLGRYRFPEKNLEAVLIFDRKRAEYILAAWSVGDEEKSSLEFVCEPVDVKIVHPYGDAEIRTMPNPPLPDQKTRTLVIPIDQNPKFIHSVDKFTYLPEAVLALDPPKIYLNPGDKTSLRIPSHPLLGDIEFRVVEASVPDGFKWDQESGVLFAEDNLIEGIYQVSALIEARSDDKSGGRTKRFQTWSKIEVLPVLSMSLRPFLENEKLYVQASIVNQSSRNLDGKLRIVQTDGPSILSRNPDGSVKIVQTVAPANIFTPPAPVVLKKGAFWREDLSLDIDMFLKYEKPAEWKLKFQDWESRAFKIHLAPLRDEAPRIDGNLDEWEDVNPIFLNRRDQMTRGPASWTPKDSSGEVSFWFTHDLVCVAARVMDNDPIYNPHPPNMLWKGDAIEIYLGFGGPAKRTVLNKKYDFQIGIAPTCSLNKPIAFLFHEDRILEEAKVAVKKTEEGYNLEASIPLKEFGEVKLSEGTLLGLDAAINDLDKNDWAPAGNEPGSSLMWNGTGRNWIDPSNWGMAVLKRF